MARDTHSLCFHDVPILASGDESQLGALEALLLDVAFSRGKDDGAEPIHIHLLSTPADEQSHPGLQVQMESIERVRIVERDAEAVLYLEPLVIEARVSSCTGTTPDSPSARVLTTALLFALRERGIVSLHAAAMVDRERAIIIVGDSGAGKTTTALGLLEAGCVPMTDDQVFFRRRDDAWDVLSAPQAFRVTPRTLAAFPGLESSRGELVSRYGKYEVSLANVRSGTDHFRGPLQLLFPRQRPSDDTELSFISAAETLGELMVASPLVALGDMERCRQHATLLQVLAASSAARLELGTDLLADPGRVAGRVLAQLPRAPSR